MRPVLFAKTATQFNTNGIGRLDAISCIVTEEQNGMYELELEIAETAEHASEIELSSIIVAKPSQGKEKQPFRVCKITKPINGRFTVSAQHISYQLSFIPTMPFEIQSATGACNQTLQALKTNAAESCPFTFWTDITTASSYKQTLPASIRSRLGGVEGSVLDQFGGEYEWDNYTVKLWRNRGLTVPQVLLRYGKNITDLNQEENIESTITGIVPYWQSSEGDITVTLPEKVIDSQYAANYPFKRTVPHDFSQDFEETPTQAQLRARAQSYVNASGIGIPKVSIKVSFISLSDTEDYKDVAALQAVNLCDNVSVYFEKLGISTTAKVVRTEYDVLCEKYNSVEIGSVRSSLAGTIADTSGAISTVANNTRNMFKSYTNTVNGLIDNATSWLTSSGGYVIAVKNQDGSWKELLFLDTNDVETAHKVLRVNENGIGFSSTGVAGPYTQAWTLDGKLVIGGTNVPSLTVYDNSNNIIFQVSRSGLIWNVANSSMDANGNITAKNLSIDSTNFDLDSNGNMSCTSATVNNATIKGGTLTIVQDVSGTEVEIFKVSNQGKLTIKSTSNVTVFEADKDGVMWQQSGTYGGESRSSSMTKQGYLTAQGASFTNATINGGTLVVKNLNNVELFKVSSSGQLTVKNANDEVIFQTSASGTVWNSPKSSMNANGVITAADASFTNATINGGTLVVKNSNDVELFRVSNTGQLTVKNAYDDVVFQAGSDGIAWNQSGIESGVQRASTMSKAGHFTAQGAELTDATISGGSLYQENNGRYLQIVNGNIHGGPLGSDQIVYLAYQVNGVYCIALQADGVCFSANNIYVGDRGSNMVYQGYDGSVVTDVNTVATTITGQQMTIKDYDGVEHTFYALSESSYSFNTFSSTDTKNVKHGLVLI